jgi:transcription elongation GreA/GreB family factor
MIARDHLAPDASSRDPSEERGAREGKDCRSEKGTARPVLSGRDGIRVGDRVVIRNLDDNKTSTFTLSTARDDQANGVLGSASPLGRVLLGAAEEDEVEFEAGGRTRRVLIVRTEHSASAA